MCGWQVKLCDFLANKGQSERFRDEVLYNKALYKSTLLCLTLLYFSVNPKRNCVWNYASRGNIANVVKDDT